MSTTIVEFVVSMFKDAGPATASTVQLLLGSGWEVAFADLEEK